MKSNKNTGALIICFYLATYGTYNSWSALAAGNHSQFAIRSTGTVIMLVLAAVLIFIRNKNPKVS